MVSSQELREGWRTRRSPTRKRLREKQKGILWKARSKGMRVGTADPAGAGATQTETLMACGAVSLHCPGQTRKNQ